MSHVHNSCTFRPLRHWGRGFESNSMRGYLSAFLLCLCCPVYVAALRRADPPTKESYRLVYVIRNFKKQRPTFIRDCKGHRAEY
jgi:hypothetical protein